MHTPPTLLLAIAAVALAVGCNHVTEETITGTRPVLDGPRGALKSPEQQASEAATAKLTDYYQLKARLAADPAADLAILDDVAAGPALDTLRADITAARTRPPAPVETVLQTAITSHDVPKDKDGTPIPGTATVRLDICIGTPQPADQAMKTMYVQPVMTDTAWPDPAGWRVTASTHYPICRATVCIENREEAATIMTSTMRRTTSPRPHASPSASPRPAAAPTTHRHRHLSPTPPPPHSTDRHTHQPPDTRRPSETASPRESQRLLRGMGTGKRGFDGGDRSDEYGRRWAGP